MDRQAEEEQKHTAKDREPTSCSTRHSESDECMTFLHMQCTTVTAQVTRSQKQKKMDAFVC